MIGLTRSRKKYKNRNQMEWAHLLLLFAIGTIAGFINVNAGGGSSLTLPTLYSWVLTLLQPMERTE